MLCTMKRLLSNNERDINDEPGVTLNRALKHGWLELWYQPKYCLQNTRLIGAEGLIRARHPEIGVVGPGAFLPGATEDDMLAMTEFVISTALRDWVDCSAVGAGNVKLSVNVPASAFLKLQIAKMIREQRPRAADWPGIILEVTEDEVIRDLQVANDVAFELRTHNCELAIDDFGAGYSSLARLRELPFAELKIDRAYVMACDADKMNARILESIIELAHRFELTAVAEGIETPHESHKLQGLGCDVGQGFWFAKPLAKDDFLTKIGRTGAKPPADDRRSWWGGSPKLRATV
jgi:EAL domain-containing protein (putative c-di-GMP-specific phosphodiesterase class I)